MYFRKKYHDPDRGRWLSNLTFISGIIIGVFNVVVYVLYCYHVEYLAYFILIIFLIEFSLTPTLIFGLAKILQLKEKKRKWKPLVVVILMLLGLIISSLSFEVWYLETHKTFPNSSYTVIVTSNNSNPYFMYVPSPLNQNHDVSEIVNTFEKLQGNVNISIINTAYGFALNLSASGNFSISSSIFGYPYVFYYVSLMTSHDNFSIYLNSSLPTSSNIVMIGKSNAYFQRLNFQLSGIVNKTGWSNVKGHYDVICID